MRARQVFDGSEAAQTRKYLSELAAKGCEGAVAAMLFRAQKASTRAKQYRGGQTGRDGIYRSNRDLAYKNKGQALEKLCDVLMTSWPVQKWGWGSDNTTVEAPHVLYVDISTGQVSFHSAERFAGPDYRGKWDGIRGVSVDRVIDFCDQICSGVETLPLPF